MFQVLCVVTITKTREYIPLIGILYERPYWKETPGGETLSLQLTTYVKSRGFPFRLHRDEIKILHFHSRKFSNITMPQLVHLCSDYGENVLLKNIIMELDTSRVTVDILVRTVIWKNYKNTAKILFLLTPSNRIFLRKLAKWQNIKSYF